MSTGNQQRRPATILTRLSLTDIEEKESLLTTEELSRQVANIAEDRTSPQRSRASQILMLFFRSGNANYLTSFRFNEMNRFN